MPVRVATDQKPYGSIFSARLVGKSEVVTRGQSVGVVGAQHPLLGGQLSQVG
jgi:hypothetical protein